MTRPLALDLPLHGRQWIEASAGTGKTFTLSLLVLRLLLEREIPLPDILAVTFTKAATQELKIRIRAQIVLALDLLEQGLTGDSATDVFLKSLLPGKTQAQLRRLLAIALQDCDRASIFTIHGFCARVLANHALSAGQLLQTPELLTSTAAINTRIALDVWREFGNNADVMRSLLKLWPTPEALARQCDVLLQAEHLLPAAPDVLPEAFDMTALNARLHNAVELHGEEAHAVMLQAQASGVLHKSHMSRSIIERVFGSLATWHSLAIALPFEDPGFKRLSKEHIASKVGKAHKDKTPESPLFETVALWYEGYARVQALEEARDAQCLHLVRHRLMQRRSALLEKLQQYGYDDLIQQVVQAIEGENGSEFCAALRKEYPVALLDEFQDTDSQQWKIFSALYPEQEQEHALYLIGDPKQAIYGFRGGDVHAYLAAKRESRQHWNLPENFRSRPLLLGAVASLFEQGGENVFREPDIRFYPVQAGGKVRDDDFLWQENIAPAMQLALLPEYVDARKNKAAALPAAKARELAARACVEKIHEVLLDGQRGKARIADSDNGGMRNIEPGDIAILVNQNREARQMQESLSACGIASVISSQENLFATFEARELFVVLDALLHHRDQSRWRGALSTFLLGFDARQILQLDSETASATHSADLAVRYRELWQQRGVLSLVNELCAQAATRMLRLADGERRLGNYLQLGETLQQASAQVLGPEQCLHWLAHAMQDAGVDDENTLRLDSDQKRVKILTLHKSKGLEFPLVFMPFASFGKTSNASGGLKLLNYHEEHRRVTHAMIYGDDESPLVEVIKSRAASEDMAEQIRLLYVGLTRARHYCWVCCGLVHAADKSGFSSLLFRNEKDDIRLPVHADYLQKLKGIAQDNAAIVIDEISSRGKTLPLYQDKMADSPIRIAAPALHVQQDWRVSSFSQLTQGSSHASPMGSAADDEAGLTVNLPENAESVFDRRFSGIAFGNALHHALENADVRAWAMHEHAGLAPTTELGLLQDSLLRQGYGRDDLAAGVAQLSPLVFHTLRATLPENIRLCDLPDSARLNEMEFHFSLRDCDARDLLALLKGHGMLLQREDFPFLRRLNGLMTGKVDLIYRHEGRFYICDYKSNRLPGYDSERCLQAMRDSEYDFQALIYTLALHRWCKFRLPDYDYDRHMGGVRYLFCRGLDADKAGSSGIAALRFEHALIEQLENLLHPAGASAT